MRQERIAVSVVVPSHNSARVIRDCLTALRHQETVHPYEVIVVDSSNDGTHEIVAKEFPEVRLYHFPERCSVGRARNVGLKKTRGNTILFLDTDCVPPPTWIAHMLQGLCATGADAVGGSVENGTPSSITGSLGFYLEFFRVLASKDEPHRTIFFIGGNSAFRKKVFMSPPYPRYADGNLGEDFFFNWQLSREGKSLWFLPGVPVRHCNRTGLRRVLRYQYELGRGACFYRQSVSPTITAVLRRRPLLCVFMPFAVLPWVGWTIFRRRGARETLKFAALLPAFYVAINAWAAGFYRESKRGELRQRMEVGKVVRTYAAQGSPE